VNLKEMRERKGREGRRKKNQVAMLFKIACVLPH
jgi:hypothetical protein